MQLAGSLAVYDFPDAVTGRRLGVPGVPRQSLGDWGQIIGQAVVAAGQYAAAHEQKQASKEQAKAEVAVAKAQKDLAVLTQQGDILKSEQQGVLSSEAFRQKALLAGAGMLTALLGIMIWQRKRRK